MAMAKIYGKWSFRHLSILPLEVKIRQLLHWMDLRVLCLNAKFDINSCKKIWPPRKFGPS
jgi:hypothetical protein